MGLFNKIKNLFKKDEELIIDDSEKIVEDAKENKEIDKESYDFQNHKEESIKNENDEKKNVDKKELKDELKITIYYIHNIYTNYIIENVKIYEKGLTKTRENFVSKLINLTNKYNKITEEYFDELEEILIMADIGVNTVMEFMDRLRKRVSKEKIEDVNSIDQFINNHYKFLKDIAFFFGLSNQNYLKDLFN